jgi:hypothetical protein
MEKGAPVFVKIEEYRDVLDIIALLKDKVKEANGIIENIAQIKAKEDAEIENWQASIDDVEGKIDILSSSLVEVNEI